MDPKYDIGGAIFESVYQQYGEEAAFRLMEIAASGNAEAVNSFLSDLRRGTTGADYSGSTSTAGNFWDQITTDPLAAPLESANRQLGLAWGNILTRPWVLVSIALVVFFALGGADFLKRRLARL